MPGYSLKKHLATIPCCDQEYISSNEVYASIIVTSTNIGILIDITIIKSNTLAIIHQIAGVKGATI